jgi:inorganic triphosphatase YgiF
LRLTVRSKAARGYGLVQGVNARAVPARRVALSPDASTAEVFGSVAASCLFQVAGNWDAVHRNDPEGVHEMRVGLRRLRGALSLFSEMLRDSQSQKIKEDLKWLTSELGPARQLHVFAERMIEYLRTSNAPACSLEKLDEEIRRRRTEAEAGARAAICSERFRTLLLAAAEWIEALTAWRRSSNYGAVYLLALALSGEVMPSRASVASSSCPV